MQALYLDLKTTLAISPLYWTSKTYFAIEAVRLPFWCMWGYRRQKQTAYELLAQQARLDGWNKTWQLVGRQLCQAEVYRRPVRQLAAHELRILIRQGLFYTGIRTTVFETW